MSSTTARLAWGTLILLGLDLLVILCLPLLWPGEALASAAEAIGTVALAIAGGGGLGTAAYGVRHIGSAAPTSRQLESRVIPATEP